MFGGFISEKFNKFNLLLLLPFIYIIQIILPVHLISGAKYHYVNSHLEDFASQEEINKTENNQIYKNNKKIDEIYPQEIIYDKSMPTDISYEKRYLIYKTTWKEVFNIVGIFNPFGYLPKNNDNKIYGISEDSLKNINNNKNIKKIDNKNKSHKKKFESWQRPFSAQGILIICFIINILVMKYYWKKDCLKF
jgi:hypothetical protein